MAGADVILLPSMYPSGPATMHPTMSPITIDADFIAGEPTNSSTMMVMKERNPSPMYSGEPQGRAWGDNSVGQREKNPVSGRAEHGPDPPAVRETCVSTRAWER